MERLSIPLCVGLRIVRVEFERPSQWSNSIKAGLCALFDEGCVKNCKDAVKLEGYKGEG